MTSSAAPTDTVPLRFEFQWDRREHVRLIRAVTRHRLTGRLSRAALPILATALVAFVLVVPFLRAGADPIAAWLAAAPWLVVLALWLGLLRWGVPYLNAWTFQRQNHCAAHPMRRIVSARGVRTECDTTSSDISWTGIRGAVETDEFILFYVTPACAVQLPKRAIHSPSDLTELRAVLRANVGAAAKLLDREAAGPLER